MRVLTWGLGYVGNVVAACLADDGHDVVVIEPQKAKVDALNDGRSPIKEPGLDELVERNVSAGRLRAATHGIELVAESECSLICVGTPSAPDGGPVLDYLDAASEDIAEGLAASSNYHVVVVRSTVFPGTARGRVLPLLEQRFNPAIVDVLANEADLARDIWGWMEDSLAGQFDVAPCQKLF